MINLLLENGADTIREVGGFTTSESFSPDCRKLHLRDYSYSSDEE